MPNKIQLGYGNDGNDWDLSDPEHPNPEYRT